MADTFRALCAELADAYLRTLEHINNSTWLGYEPSDDPLLQRARASLADEPPAPAPPADGEVAELVEMLKGIAYWRLHGTDKPTPFDIRQAAGITRAAELLQRQAPVQPADGEVAELVAKLRRLAPQNPLGTADPTITRAADLLERQVLVPVAVSDALIKAECALSDIAEGEPMTDEGDPLKWAERRCADTLAVIRPTMMQHKIRTSEWPPVAATAKPLPEVGE